MGIFRHLFLNQRFISMASRSMIVFVIILWSGVQGTKECADCKVHKEIADRARTAKAKILYVLVEKDRELKELREQLKSLRSIPRTWQGSSKTSTRADGAVKDRLFSRTVGLHWKLQEQDA